MKRTHRNKNKIVTQSCVCLLAIAFASQAHADKTCPGASCAVPDNAICSTYREQILTTPDSGSEVPHPGELIFLFAADNCHKENSNAKGSLTHSVSWTKSVGLSITAGVTVSASVKASVGLPLVGDAEATAGISSHLDGTTSGSASQTTTDTATWNYDIPACGAKSANLLGDWKSCSWSKTGNMKGYYFIDSSGPVQTVTCMNVTGSSTGSSKYYSWTVSENADQKCSSCK